MPAESKKQQEAAGAALAVKRGQAPLSSLKGAARGMHKSMSAAQLADFAKTPRTTKEVIGGHPAAGNPHPKKKRRAKK